MYVTLEVPVDRFQGMEKDRIKVLLDDFGIEDDLDYMVECLNNMSIGIVEDDFMYIKIPEKGILTIREDFDSAPLLNNTEEALMREEIPYNILFTNDYEASDNAQWWRPGFEDSRFIWLAAGEPAVTHRTISYFLDSLDENISDSQALSMLMEEARAFKSQKYDLKNYVE